MAVTFTLPIIGETVTEGIVERWLKRPGETVRKFEPLVEINTDKVNVELPSPFSGVLVEILAPEGATVPVGAPLALIELAEGEELAGVEPLAPPEPSAPPAPEGPRRATPRVRRLAEELGVDLGLIAGTGPGGRITEEDVRQAASRPGQPAGRPGEPPPEEEAVPVTSIRQTIARRMVASAFRAPHAWLAVEADVTGLARLRLAARDAFRQKHGSDLTYLPFAVHAVAQALPGHPYLNASWSEAGDAGPARIILRKRVNIGIAVATDRGLMVPVIRDADRRSITELALAIDDLGRRAREGRLQVGDVQGGTFTVDNTGAFGSVVSMPIINEGQAAIMTLEAVTKRPTVVAEDAIAVRYVVALCLSFDHRILDGHQAGAFLMDVRRRMEAWQPGDGIE